MKWLHAIKNGILSYIRYSNWVLILGCLAATGYGVALLYSASVTAGGGKSDYMIQLVAGLVGLVLALAISKIDYELICHFWPVYLVISLALVLVTFSSAGLMVADDKAWLEIPGIGITVQPSEFLKIAFIISFSVHLSRVREHLNELRVLIPVCLHGLAPAALIIKQGDDGTALVFLCIFASMLLIAGLRPFYFLLAATGVVAAVPLVWTFFLDDDKKGRFLSILPQFVEQYKDGIGFQQFWGLVTIGSGGATGKGYLEGGQLADYVPARSTDMVFTVAAEEFGFLGGLLLFGILVVILLALLHDALNARDAEGSLICGGILAMIGSQCLINLGMNLRVLPVVGITLPFFSRGGSSLATLYLSIGLALSVHYSSRVRVRESLFARRTV